MFSNMRGNFVFLTLKINFFSVFDVSITKFSMSWLFVWCTKTQLRNNVREWVKTKRKKRSFDIKLLGRYYNEIKHAVQKDIRDCMKPVDSRLPIKLL